MIKLIGILIILIGFIIKLDTIAVVVLAGIATGLVSGMSFNDVMTTLGKAFVENRYMSIFIISLPVIGLLERYGLRERAAYLISKLKSATVGRLTSLYLVIRTVAAMFGIRIGGHVQFIRPLILPMAMGAGKNRYGKMDKEDVETVKGLEGAVENYGNFFGQNFFVASGGVLLIVGVMKEQGYIVEAVDIAKASLPIALIIMVIGSIQFLYYDKKFDKKYKSQLKSQDDKQ
ncbi:putative membrane protein [Clostridium tetanomorphum]|uniref:DUF969 domain-containing protein n=1 Tax=Clostridium tetanomorphum TaxID=1553 RepID=A0A923E6V7_CLOTT|nr:DUF969 domain-containing protein [Clostridium tetanomorphum]KAJ51310.1 hypothetical protein CTM_13638 [Clostridium tetanomorphum DSM 665]MBC2397560.1 DUF969 domain-containing protein [Clostridium tetanomorphum]MBP1863657.1 putative membrane protein [Clostridium tetanomorphum]NRS86233.1 putative membrane protein [Clostridium tetanomorphum]NRZ95688.1 putative membrane protein [Clostridium tetanomorphum]